MTDTTPTTTPPKRRPSARSEGKSRVKPGKGWPPAVRSKAIEVLRVDGVAEAHRATGVPKSTLTRWAKAEGVDVGDQARARTGAATEAVRARAAEVKLTTVQLLEEHIVQAGHFLLEVTGVNAAAAQHLAQVGDESIVRKVGPFGAYIEVDQATDAAKLINRAQALAGLPLAVRDAEGVMTRAIHDLQLLRGEATERGDLVVNFNVPRPDATVPGVVLEVAIDED